MSHQLISAEISVGNRFFPIFVDPTESVYDNDLVKHRNRGTFDARAAKVGDAEANGWTTERWYKARMSNGAMGWMRLAPTRWVGRGRGAVFFFGGEDPAL